MRRNIIPVAIAAVLCGVVIRTAIGSGTAPGPMQQLVRLKPQRPFAARLSIPTAYDDCTAQPANPADTLATVPVETCGEPDEDTLDLRAWKDAGESTDPDSLQVSALTAMIWPDTVTNPLAPDEPIMRLTRALRLSTRRVPLLVDLSAAHLVRAERTQNPRDLFEAVEYASEALELEPRNEAARYNLALALQAWGLEEEADKAWDAYLAIDSTLEWADEARRRKQALITHAEIPFPGPSASDSAVADFARRYPQAAREYGWDQVLGDWGKAIEEDDPSRAAAHVDLAERVGSVLEQRQGGDRSLADAVRAIRQAQSDRAATMTLARAHREYARGQAHVNKYETTEASQAFRRVVGLRPRSPVLLQWATLFRISAEVRTEQPSITAAQLRALLARVDSSHYPALLGRARLWWGNFWLRDGRYDSAGVQFHYADLQLRRAGEIELNAAVWSSQGELAYAQGDTLDAYRTFHRAHRALRPYRQSLRLHNHLSGLARPIFLDGMRRAAFPVFNEDVSVSKRTGTPVAVVDALQSRARGRRALGDLRGADRDLDSALVYSAALPNEEAQRQWAASVIRMSGSDRVSAAARDSSVDVLEQNPMWLLPVLKWRAGLHAAEGNLDSAVIDLERLIQGTLAEAEADSRNAGALLEQARSSFDALVMLNIARGRPADALQTLERGRLSFVAPWRAAAPAADVRLSAPPGHVAVEYGLIGDTLLVWTIRADTIRMFRQRVDRDTFMLTVDQVVAALESPARAANARSGLRSLYDWLIRPVRGYLGPPETPLVILADGEVAGVPFAALLDSAREKYLIEDYPLRYAPSLADAAHAAPPRAASGLALLVADPAFDEGQYPALKRLTGARREVDSLLAIYRENARLQGAFATRDAFVNGARSASIIHYAGHAVFDDARPERSYLVLAGADTTGRLSAEAVSTLDLDGVRLVVLSACRTLRSREGRSGGFEGLSGAMLTAGAGGVVGSLWQVNDRLTQPLMQAFHQEYQKPSSDPARALRNAQLRMLRSEGNRASPAAWAGFRYTGAERP